MNGTLYLVATPIGNLDEITLRALDTLKTADLILCEDTAHSARLLNHYGIKADKQSYHKFNEASRAASVIEALRAGKNIALISDAGMPCVSDPGARLVEECRGAGIPVTVISGASAVINAYALSGFSGGFTFLGFLPEKAPAKKKLLDAYKNLPSALIFYCAPHDIAATLDFLYKELSARAAVVCRELTKLHEEIIRYTLGDEITWNVKGEFVIVVKGADEADNPLLSLTPEEHLKSVISSGLSVKDAVKKVAADRGADKNSIYQLTVKK
ncbi:MAG: 16S rRNA (cytidine(1402)-2'-O)-methyltransferase [Clostridiales bacterium]|jgi:16S rRNA (cytidine1402-2'-O)-methyltransferase|nr:16S rRNA (cytidine(1402)-2'-O)-methyltransferase [Clostridiales bacterium]